MAKINYAKIQSQVSVIKEKITEQHFQIDVAYSLFKKIKDETQHRNDLNTPVIAAYWAREIFNHYLLNNYTLLRKAVFFEADYYSYLDLLERVEVNAKLGNVTYIVDLITDSTDVKTGEDLDVWVGDNDFFTDSLKNLWSSDVLPEWQKEDKLVTRKNKPVNLDQYWNYEDYLYMLTILDTDLNPIVIFLLGTYVDYK